MLMFMLARRGTFFFVLKCMLWKGNWKSRYSISQIVFGTSSLNTFCHFTLCICFMVKIKHDQQKNMTSLLFLVFLCHSRLYVTVYSIEWQETLGEFSNNECSEKQLNWILVLSLNICLLVAEWRKMLYDITQLLCLSYFLPCHSGRYV